MLNRLLALTVLLVLGHSGIAQTELITDGDFGSGSSLWETYSAFMTAATSSSGCNTCPGYAVFPNGSGNVGNNAYGVLSQELPSISSNVQSGTISFTYKITTEEVQSVPFDKLTVSLMDGGGNIIWFKSLSNVNASNGYVPFDQHLSANQIQGATKLFFTGDNDGAKPTTFRIDDVSLTVSSNGGQGDPNLVVTGLTLSESSVSPGQSIDVSFDIENFGNASADGSQARIYLSDNEILSSTTDDLLGSVSVGSISAGGNRSKTKSVDLPQNVQTGTLKYILVKADFADDVSESDEGDNVSTESISFPNNSSQNAYAVVNILPYNVVGAKWRIDGGPYHDGGEPPLAVSPGNHTITFKSVDGWLKPDPYTRNYSANIIHTTTATYLQGTTTGSVTMILRPNSAVQSGCQWRLDNGPWKNSGQTVSNVAAGAHMIDFLSSNTNAYETPSPRTFLLNLQLIPNITLYEDFTAVGGDGQQFVLDPNGMSHLFWPFENSSWSHKNNWRDPYTMWPHLVTVNNELHNILNSEYRTHWGADWNAQDWQIENYLSCDQVFHTPMRGEVIFVENGVDPDCDHSQNPDAGGGNMVVIHSSQNQDFCLLVCHFNFVYVHQGQMVDIDDPIGIIGETGMAYSPHVHSVLYKNVNAQVNFTQDPEFHNKSLLEILEDGVNIVRGNINQFNSLMRDRYSTEYKFDATRELQFGGYVAPPPVALQITGSTSFCQGDSVILTCSASNSYLWSTGDTTQSITVFQSGTYQVQIRDIFGELGVSREVEVFVYEDWNAEINVSGDTVILLDEVVTLMGNADASDYQWSTGDTLAAISVTEPGTYILYATDPIGCRTTSTSITLSYSDQAPKTNFEGMHLGVYPNPNSGDFHITYSNPPSERVAQILIFDATGRSVFNDEVGIRDTESQVILDRSLAPGMYYVRVSIADFSSVVKLIIVN